jgi:hypothetical protein
MASLGAGMLGSVGTSGKTAAADQDAPPVTLLIASSSSQNLPDCGAKQAAPAQKSTAAKAVAKSTDKSGQVQTASIGKAATDIKIPSASANSQKCKVFTASYGGQKAVIIKAPGGDTVNYTVLDVTDANEKREIDAYIQAYAKGGERIGSFPTQTKALHKAFELCPEG